MHRFVKAAWKCLHAILVISGALFFIGVGIWLSHFKRSFDISGQVIDADTGQPVSRAKVIVAAWESRVVTAGSHKFGTIADEKGKFRIAAAPGFFIAWRDVMASSPDDKYAELKYLKTDYAPLAVRPLTYWERDLDTYHYQTFEGCWTGKTTWLKQP